LQHLGQDLVFGANGLDSTVTHHQKTVDTGNGAGAMSDYDDDTVALTHAKDGSRQRVLAVAIEI
jgi:hypothetical protein